MIPNKYKGLLIAFEGLDGAGSSTQTLLLSALLEKQGLKTQVTREPTNNLIGGLIRGQLTGEWKASPECLQLLFAADRAHHQEKEIIPMLKKGYIVICDRYVFSTIAFGSLSIKDRKWLENLNDKFIVPDITFILKVPPKICLMRLEKVRYSLELYEQVEKMQKIWRVYEKIAQEFPNIHIIEGERKEEKILTDTSKIVKKALKA